MRSSSPSRPSTTLKMTGWSRGQSSGGSAHPPSWSGPVSPQTAGKPHWLVLIEEGVKIDQVVYLHLLEEEVALWVAQEYGDRPLLFQQPPGATVRWGHVLGFVSPKTNGHPPPQMWTKWTMESILFWKGGRVPSPWSARMSSSKTLSRPETPSPARRCVSVQGLPSRGSGPWSRPKEHT